MSPMKRYAKKQAKARQRRRLQAHERLERDRRQAQRAAEALHQALENLGLPANLVVEIEGRLRSQHKLLGKIIGVMFPALFGCRTRPPSCVVCAAGTRIGPRACSERCRIAPGSSGCGVWGWRCSSPSGVMSTTKVRLPRAAGNGPGSGMTRCSRSMGRSYSWLAGGGAASTNGCCRALMGSCCWWSWGMAAWSCQSILPFDGLIL